MKQLTENKDRFIDRNPNLTFEQAQEIKNFFNTHNEAEALMGDWQRDSSKWTYDDFSKFITDYEHRNTKSNADRIANKKGIEGIVLDEDYLDLGEYTMESWGTFHAYSPLTHLGAKVLAGPQVPPVQDDKDSAGWCIGWSGNDTYWNQYCNDDKYFIILCGEKVPTLKVCLEILNGFNDWRDVKVWDYYDHDNDMYSYMNNYFSEEDGDVIMNLINDAKNQGAYAYRAFASFEEEEDRYFDTDEFLFYYAGNLISYDEELRNDLIDKFGEYKVFYALNHVWLSNPVEQISDYAESYFYDDGIERDDEINEAIANDIHCYYNKVEEYILDLED